MSAARTRSAGKFGLLHATALNMSNMIGVGPFITIPLLMSALGGPQALLGWLVAVAVAIPDGLVWSELGASMPGSGGSYVYLREAYRRDAWGRLMVFLFIWQFILSGPLEIASGYIGFARYVRYLQPGLTHSEMLGIAVLVGVLNIALLYRPIRSIAALTVSFWAGTLVTAAAVIATGAWHFDSRQAFDFPPGAFNFSLGFLFGVGAASRVAMFDYLGYYTICYIGDEVEEPGRVIPRSIIVSIVSVAALYLAINLSVLGVVPWRQFVPAEAHPESGFIVSTFMERIYGSGIASVFTIFVLWTAFSSVFALLLGYSRIPYAAALDGHFFPVFARLHPTKRFPYVSLLVIGAIAIVCSLFSLELVIDGLIVTRILVQFLGQVFALILLRRRRPDLRRPFRMWLYPLPAVAAFVGWVFIFVTAPMPIIALGVGTLCLGVVSFLGWAWKSRGWPFAPPVERHRLQLAGADLGEPVADFSEEA